MSYVAEAARDTLRSAGVNLRQARRTLFLAGGLLALLHLLTVSPYIAASKRLDAIQATMDANQGLLAAVDPGIDSLAKASARASQQLEESLHAATQDMVGQFRSLRPLVADAQEGRVLHSTGPAGPSPQQWPVPPQMELMPPQAQMELMPPQAQMEQMPPQGLPPADINAPGIPTMDSLPETAIDPNLHAALTAIAEHKPDAYLLMTAYGRDWIVQPAYERVQWTWDRDIRPVYTQTLTALIKSAKAAAAKAPAEAATTAADLSTAADRLVERQSIIAAVELRHDAMVDQSLDSDWWFTVQGKTAYADAVIRSIQEQLDAVLGVASGASKEIEETLDLQVKLYSEIKASQDLLREQFKAQHSQLAALSGFGGALPIDLGSFIGLFPLVLGLVLGLLLLRASEERRQAAQAAADLAATADGEPQSLQWLIRQALGASSWPATAVVTFAIALAAAAWVWFAGDQLQDIEPPPVLRPQVSALLGTAMIAAAALWDLAAMLRLSRAGAAHTP